jgi:AraC-like DNA-binding protein
MLETYQILILFLVVLPLHFFVNMLTYKRIQAKANTFLAGFMLVVFLQYLLLLGETLQYPRLAIISYYLVIPIMLLNAPLLFLYIRKLTSVRFRLIPELFIHILPFIIVLIINLFTFGKVPFETKYLIVTHQFAGAEYSRSLEVYLSTYRMAQTFYNIQVLIYSVLMIIILFLHGKKIKNFFSYTENISLNWLKIFVIMFASITMVDVFLYSRVSPELYNVIMILYLGFLGYFGLKQTDIYPRLVPGMPAQLNLGLEAENSIIVSSDEDFIKNTKFTLSDSEIDLVIVQMEISLRDKKLFTNSKLSLDDLAGEAGIHKNYLSYIINNKLNKNFYQLINEYRVEEAKKLLRDNKFDHLSIEGIAQTVGFNSKSVFNPIFKRLTGITPSEFRKLKSF